MSQEFISNAVLGNHAFSDPSVVEIAARLSGENRRDFTNTLEFASRNAHALAPEDKSWPWFRDFTSAIAKLGWTMQTPGSEDVNLGKTQGTSALANLITKMANVMRIAIEVNKDGISIPSRRQLAQDPGLFGQSSASTSNWSFAVTDIGFQNDVLTMQMVAVEFKYTENAGPFGQFSSSHAVRAERFYFTANRSFLDAHREEVERRPREVAK